MVKHLLASIAILTAAATLQADPDMKSTNPTDPAAKGAACTTATSACGLPSNVVIDMSKATVRHTDAEWRKLLTPEQFEVAREQGTEPPFHNEYWDNHEDGVYFSVCSDTPLFDSRDKFNSGTGWAPVSPSRSNPSSSRPSRAHIPRHGPRRGALHDRWRSTWAMCLKTARGRRASAYCINSASLRFMPRKQYEAWVAAHGSAAK